MVRKCVGLTSLDLLVLHAVDSRLVDSIQPVVKLQDHPFALPARTHTPSGTLSHSHQHICHCNPGRSGCGELFLSPANGKFSVLAVFPLKEIFLS